MNKIIPHLWYDKEAKEAALFYISLFEDSRLLDITVWEGTPSGDAETVNFQLAGQPFSAISAGPFFKFNPSISLMVACYSVDEVNDKWKALSVRGSALMPLGEYPFSKWYGWIQDRYGLSWQLMLVDQGQGAQKISQKITPNMLFSNTANGKAEAAVKYYTEVFENSEIDTISRYGPGEAQSAQAQVNFSSFKLCGINFSAMDHGYDVDFTFNEAFSLMVLCQNQKEIDYYWEKLSAVPEAEQCGWLKDQFGVSWQIVPVNLQELLSQGSKEGKEEIYKIFLKMKKIDIAALEKARMELDNKGLQSSTFRTDKAWTEQEINDLFQNLAGGSGGSVFRAKGFLNTPSGKVKVNYLYGRGEIEPSSYEGPGIVVIIGKDLSEGMLQLLLPSGSTGSAGSCGQTPCSSQKSCWNNCLFQSRKN